AIDSIGRLTFLYTSVDIENAINQCDGVVAKNPFAKTPCRCPSLAMFDGINAEVHRALEERESIEITAGRTSPMWYRGNVKETPEAEAEVDAVLEAFGAQRIIVGHTPSRKGIKTVHGGKLIIVDTGMSAHYGGTRSYLEIKDGTFTAVDDGVARVLFGEAP
ncbi:MAG: hypothetical protein AAF830_11490, partial [Pseudomonadota bacterium]